MEDSSSRSRCRFSFRCTFGLNEQLQLGLCCGLVRARATSAHALAVAAATVGVRVAAAEIAGGYAPDASWSPHSSAIGAATRPAWTAGVYVTTLPAGLSSSVYHPWWVQQQYHVGACVNIIAAVPSWASGLTVMYSPARDEHPRGQGASAMRNENVQETLKRILECGDDSHTRRHKRNNQKQSCPFDNLFHRTYHASGIVEI